MTRIFRNSCLLASLLVCFLVSCTGEKPLTNDELLYRAKTMFEKADWREAKKLALQAANQNPKDVNAFIMLSLTEEKLGQEKASLDYMSEAAKLNPDSFQAQYNCGRMLFNRGRYDACKGPLMAAYRLRPKDLDTILLLAQTNMKLNLPDDALKYYRQLAGSPEFGKRPEPWNELGVILTKKGKLRSAAKAFAYAHKLDRENHSVVLNLAVFCDRSLKSKKRAIQYYSLYLKLTAQNPELEQKRREVQERIQQLNEASSPSR